MSSIINRIRACTRDPIGSWAVVLTWALFAAAGGKPLRAAEAIDFNRDIRPILSENCFYCHGQDPAKRQAELRLDDRTAAISAAAIVPGSAATSQLIARIDADDPDQLMPPPSSNRRLTAAQRDTLRRWIDAGAPYDTHWAYTPPVRPAEPTVGREGWIRNPIDRFVLAQLESQGLEPAPEADRVTLIKRLASDLTGLPPTPAEVDAFVHDTDEQAYERLVERLMSSQHYGERQALPWLDAARYADSNGFQQDGDTWQWIWRDWVVRALNEDLPFDQFTTWQLAGDLLPNPTHDQQIASAFNRNHLLNGEGGAIAEEQRWVNLFDRVDTTATTWLGLTMACAQCHDHKYDPITQRDYYSLLDAFNRVPETGTPQFFSSRIRVAAPFLELPTEENRRQIAAMEAEIARVESGAQRVSDAAFAGWRQAVESDSRGWERADWPEELRKLAAKPASERSAEEKSAWDAALLKHFQEKVKPSLLDKLPEVAQLDRLKKQLAAYRADQVPRVMIMSDAKERETHILERGEYLKPGEKVTFNTPAFLQPLPADAPRNRLGLAQWLLAPSHPLTARVQVNRMWQHFFGSGLVKTAEDFGVQSEYPGQRALLDWLAVEFRERSWSMKHMHRLIVTSATYRQSSRLTAEKLARDPENRWLSRASRFRMPSLVLRDWALASADLLDRRVGGVPVYPYQPADVWEALAITKERDFTYPASSGSDLYRRSLYTFWRRTVGPANMFDTSNRQTCRVRLTPTSTPLHALTTLNDPTWVEAARVLAENSVEAGPDVAARLTYLFRRVVCRTPQAAEMVTLQALYAEQLSIYEADAAAAEAFLQVGARPRKTDLELGPQAALTAVALGILNLDEALTRE